MIRMARVAGVVRVPRVVRAVAVPVAVGLVLARGTEVAELHVVLAAQVLGKGDLKMVARAGGG